MTQNLKIAVTIPCYKVARHIEKVIRSIGSEVQHIIAVDDACPENTFNILENLKNSEPRLTIIKHSENQGVGGAVISGYKKALELGADIVVKIDGDGQMDTSLISKLIKPIIDGKADYTKGNRFFFPKFLKSMPWDRRLANLILSFITKLSSGYWKVIDPTNGFTAIHRSALLSLNLGKVAKRYFFESDMLYHLYLRGAVVIDVPMKPIYGEEKSNLFYYQNAWAFAKGNICNMYKRTIYTYFLRNFSIASIYVVVGKLLCLFGLVFGLYKWHESTELGEPATAGTVMLAGLPFIIGMNMILNFFSYDIENQPTEPLQNKLTEDEAKELSE